MIDMPKRFPEEQQGRILTFPEGLFYGYTHVWVRGKGSEVTIELTDYA
jgi:glycine cleavage system H lipoate-binding protein